MKVLYLLLVLDMLNIAIYAPIFGVYIRSLGGTTATLGFINSSTALISFLWNPVVGSLSDQNGRRSLLIKCLLASTAGSVIISLASSSFFLIYLGKLISAFGSPVNTLIRTTVADIYKNDDDKKEFFRKVAPLVSVTFLCGSVTGGFLTELNGGYSISFLLMASTTGLASVITYTLLQNDDKTSVKEPTSTDSSSIIQKIYQEISTAVKNLKSLTWSHYWDVFVIKGFFDFSVVMLTSNLGFFMTTEFNIKGRSSGYVMVVVSICGIIANIVKLKLANQLAKIPDYVKIIQFGIVVFISYLGMAASTSIYICLTFLAMFITSKNFLDSFFDEILITKSSESDRGSVFSAFGNLFPFASIVAPAFSGLFAKIFGERLLVASASLAVGVSIAVAYMRKDKKD